MNSTQPNLRRVAMVTGGSGGLGQAIIAKLKHAGTKVVALDLFEPESWIESPDLFLRCDTTSEEDVNACVSQIISAFDRIDILVNNTGIQGPFLPVTEIPLTQWRSVIDVNLTGTFICTKAVAPIMASARWGRIVMISSLQAKEGTQDVGAYAASKGAQITLSKVLAKELASFGVTVNCITPTAVDTGMANAASEEQKAAIVERIPMGRLCSAEEVAAMVAWVTSEACSFSTGSIFDVSGGRATW